MLAAKDLELAVEGAREHRRSLASSIVRRIKQSRLPGAFDGLREATEHHLEQRQVTKRVMTAACQSPIQVQVFESRVQNVHTAKVQTTDEAKDKAIPAPFADCVPYKSFEDPHTYTLITLSPSLAWTQVVAVCDSEIAMGIINKQTSAPPREVQR